MIKIKVNGVDTWRVDKYTFIDPQMGIRSIQLALNHPSDCLRDIESPSFVGATVEYKGETYSVSNSKPAGEKSTSSLDYIYTLQFKGVEEQLTRRKVRNLATLTADTFISQGTQFSLHGDIEQFKQLIESNLTYYFGDDWNVVVSKDAPRVSINVNNLTIWELLEKVYELFNLRWKIQGKTITIGYTPDIISHVFDYGVSGGLAKITRATKADVTYNRLAGVGSPFSTHPCPFSFR